MKPFKPGVGMLVAGTPAAVVPCYLDGTLEAFPPGAWLPTWSKVRLRIGAPQRFEGVPAGREGWEQITTTLEQDVRALGGLPPLAR
jgi:1-acyl-sn-glycerol-3-phosphate acyltransferase